MWISTASPPDPEKGSRDGFGGDLWKYAYPATSIAPISGNVTQLYPARQHLLMHMQWWGCATTTSMATGWTA